MKLKNKIALITGAGRSKGMGYASAKKLAEEGAKIAIAATSNEIIERANELTKKGYNVIPFQVDLTVMSDVLKMVDKIAEHYGTIDIVVNNAGIGPRGSSTLDSVGKYFIDLTEEEWDAQIAANLKTTFNCIKAVLPIMINKRYGKIVNMSSVTGPFVSIPGTSAYSAAKGGVSGLTKALALEVAEYNITVNSIAPGWIDTGKPLERKGGLSSPMKRAGRPEEAANLVLFLSSDDSSYLTGHDIILDGGHILQEHKGVGDIEFE
jgi:3-oxoacyl-[acyl-carrier protein] reductase